MSQNSQSEKVGVIGLGRMGKAIATRLRATGFGVQGWNRTALGKDKAAQCGFPVVGDLGKLLARSDILVLSLFDDAAVSGVVEKMCTHDLSGKLMVDTSTIRPETIRQLEPKIRAAGAHVVDSPVSGGPDLVLAGQVGLYVGGDSADVARFQPVAQALSGRILHVGELGAGATAKIFNNMMLCGYWQVLKEALQSGLAGGLAYDQMLDILSGSPAASKAFIGRLPVLKGQDSAVGFSVDGVVKDAELFVGIADSLGVENAALSACLQSYRDASSHGLGDRDLAVMVRRALGQGD